MALTKLLTKLLWLLPLAVLSADLPEGEYVIIIPAAARNAANNNAKLVDVVGGENTFTVALGSSTNGPATHYACQWRLRQGILALYNTKIQNNPALTNFVQLFSVETNSFTNVLAQLNLVRVVLPP